MACRFNDNKFYIAEKEFFFGNNAVATQALHIRDRWIVRCDFTGTLLSQNVFCFSDSGDLLWIVEPSPTTKWGEKAWPIGSIEWVEMWKGISYGDMGVWIMIDIDTGQRVYGPEFLKTRRKLVYKDIQNFEADGFDVVHKTSNESSPAAMTYLKLGSNKVTLSDSFVVESSFAFDERIFILLRETDPKKPTGSFLWAFNKIGKKLWELDASRYFTNGGQISNMYWSLAENKPILEKNEKLYAVDPESGVVTGEFEVSDD